MSQLQLLLQKVLDAVIVMRGDGTVADWNACAEVTFGWTRQEALDRSLNDLAVPAQHREAHAMGLQRYLRTGEGPVLDRRIEISALHKSGREFPVELTITEIEYEGERAFIGFVRDISNRKAAEAALRESESRLAATYNHAFVGIAETDADGRFLRVNEQFCRITGYEPEQLRQESIFTITHPDEVTADQENFARQWAGELDNYTLEKRYVRKDGDLVWVEVDGSIVRGEEGLPSYAVRIVRDITERKAAERHQSLLVMELQHRVKNILTVVQAVALQTFKEDGDTAEQRRTFENRLAALAKVHDLLVKQNWSATPIRRVIEEAVRPFGLATRFRLAGEELLLPPHLAVTFALAMHELATNASKYGALTTDAGEVEVTWGSQGGELNVKWQEVGGPPTYPPERTGFGTRLLERGLARELRGKVQLEYPLEGMRCRIVAPLPDIEAEGAVRRIPADPMEPIGQ